jgi:hypothetical protein
MGGGRADAARPQQALKLSPPEPNFINTFNYLFRSAKDAMPAESLANGRRPGTEQNKCNQHLR